MSTNWQHLHVRKVVEKFPATVTASRYLANVRPDGCWVVDKGGNHCTVVDQLSCFYVDQSCALDDFGWRAVVEVCHYSGNL